MSFSKKIISSFRCKLSCLLHALPSCFLILLTLLGGVVVSGALLVLHLLVDAALGVYAYLLWERAARTRTRASSFLTLAADDEVVVREASGS